MDDQTVDFLARRWVDECGPEAPAQIRTWGQHLAPDTKVLFERVARHAEGLLKGGTGSKTR